MIPCHPYQFATCFMHLGKNCSGFSTVMEMHGKILSWKMGEKNKVMGVQKVMEKSWNFSTAYRETRMHEKFR